MKVPSTWRLRVGSLAVVAALAACGGDGAKKADTKSAAKKDEKAGEKAALPAEPEPAPTTEAPPGDPEPAPEPDATPGSMAQMAKYLGELAKSKAIAELAEHTFPEQGVMHLHTADGKAGKETKLDTADGKAFAAGFSGEPFTPIHYVGEFFNEIGQESDPASVLKVDEEKLTVAYEGMSGHWG